MARQNKKVKAVLVSIGALPAFPASGYSQVYGMDLRTWLTGQALNGLLAARNGFMVDIGTESVGSWAVQCAESAIKALEDADDPAP